MHWLPLQLTPIHMETIICGGHSTPVKYPQIRELHNTTTTAGVLPNFDESLPHVHQHFEVSFGFSFDVNDSWTLPETIEAISEVTASLCRIPLPTTSSNQFFAFPYKRWDKICLILTFHFRGWYVMWGSSIPLPIDPANRNFNFISETLVPLNLSASLMVLLDNQASFIGLILPALVFLGFCHPLWVFCCTITFWNKLQFFPFHFWGQHLVYNIDGSSLIRLFPLQFTNLSCIVGSQAFYIAERISTTCSSSAQFIASFARKRCPISMKRLQTGIYYSFKAKQMRRPLT